jgi:p-hydroxybenzoate 3-monooxygenase
MNLALHDVRILSEGLRRFFAAGDEQLLSRYEELALRRIWRAQHFSWWMTQMLHVTDDATDFDRLRQVGELESVAASPAAQAYLADAYTGWAAEELP